MNHLKLFEEFFFSDNTKAIQKQIEDSKAKMDLLKSRASKDPFHDSHTDLKKEYKETEKETAKLDKSFQKSVAKDIAGIEKRPFKYKTEEGQKEALDLIFYALGYTEEDKEDGFMIHPEFRADGKVNNEYRMIMRIPNQYTSISIKIDAEGNMFTKPGIARFGMIPDAGSYVQYGTSGQNNPAPTSNWIEEKRKVRTIGDVVKFIKDLRAKVKGISDRKANDYREYIRSGGSLD